MWVDIFTNHDCDKCVHNAVCKNILKMESVIRRALEEFAEARRSQQISGSNNESIGDEIDFSLEITCPNFLAKNPATAKQFGMPPGLPTDIEFDPKYDNIHRK